MQNPVNSQIPSLVTRSEISGVRGISKVLAEFEAIVEDGDSGSAGDGRDRPFRPPRRPRPAPAAAAVVAVAVAALAVAAASFHAI